MMPRRCEKHNVFRSSGQNVDQGSFPRAWCLPKRACEQASIKASTEFENYAKAVLRLAYCLANNIRPEAMGLNWTSVKAHHVTQACEVFSDSASPRLKLGSLVVTYRGKNLP